MLGNKLLWLHLEPQLNSIIEFIFMFAIKPQGLNVVEFNIIPLFELIFGCSEHSLCHHGKPNLSYLLVSIFL